MIKVLWDILGPVVLSAFSIFVSFQLIQPIAFFIDSSFNLLARRGVGKVAFVMIVIEHIILMLSIGSQSLWKKVLDSSVRFLYKDRWIVSFFYFFLSFFTLHALLLYFIIFCGYANYDHSAFAISFGKILSLIFGFFVAFLLALTEELIFRGMLYQYFSEHWNVFSSAILASIIFSLVHDITSPLNLVTTNWKLGLGLFLLGLLLNLTFIITQKIYTGMGIHAGLVYVKVVLRRLPLISYPTVLPWWLDSDLRQSSMVHLFFFIVILVILIRYRSILFFKNTQKINKDIFENS